MKTLAIDDLRVGMLITGLGRVYEVTLHDGFMGMGAAVGTVQKQDNSFKGNIYRVEAIDLPFMVIRKVVTRDGTTVNPLSHDAQPSSVDTREYRFWAQPSDEFLLAMSPNLEPLLKARTETNKAEGGAQ